MEPYPFQKSITCVSRTFDAYVGRNDWIINAFVAKRHYYLGTSCKTQFSPQMLPRLPQEIIDRIAFYLPYEKAVGISKHTKEKLTDRVEVETYALRGNLVA